LARSADGVADRLLLDVHVERVEEDAARRTVHAIDDLDRLLRQVQEAGLESVERLDTQDDALVTRVRRQLLQLIDQQIGVALPLVSGLLPGAPDRAVERSDHVLRAERARGVDA